MQAQRTATVNGAEVGLSGRLLEVLCSLPDPVEPMKRGVRANIETRRHYRMLEALGFAESRKGWWRKTRAGVLYLRDAR